MMLKLQGNHNELLRIECKDFGPEGTPGQEDRLSSVSVKVAGYAAADDVWVLGGAWRGFLKELRELERTGRGQATMEGASPQRLELVVQTIDAAGHISLSGFLSGITSSEYSQRLEFSFGFDAGMLLTLLLAFEQLRRRQR